jgi:hypothetical protein
VSFHLLEPIVADEHEIDGEEVLGVCLSGREQPHLIAGAMRTLARPTEIER